MIEPRYHSDMLSDFLEQKIERLDTILNKLAEVEDKKSLKGVDLFGIFREISGLGGKNMAKRIYHLVMKIQRDCMSVESARCQELVAELREEISFMQQRMVNMHRDVESVQAS